MEKITIELEMTAEKNSNLLEKFLRLLKRNKIHYRLLKSEMTDIPMVITGYSGVAEVPGGTQVK